jgi:hypothetical protein
MNKSLACILRDVFVERGILAEQSRWMAFVGLLPDGDNVHNDAACFYDSTPERKARGMDGATLFRYGVQIVIRAAAYAEGYAKCLEVNNELDKLHALTLQYEGELYTISNVSATSGILPLGLEEGNKRRYKWSINLLVSITR